MAVPQLVAVTFDDNFGLEAPGAHGGVTDVLAYYRGRSNPPGSGKLDEFGGAPIRTTFFDTTIYMAPPSERVYGGARGEDDSGANLRAWRQTAWYGEEIADHTVSHFNGGVVPVGRDPCCRARDWSVSQWRNEIDAARSMLSEPAVGLGIDAASVVGFRAPYLGYNESLFSALQALGFTYDSSVPNCFEPDEDAGSCGWPYSLSAGSADASAFAQVFSQVRATGQKMLPPIGRHPGLWEVPPTTLVVPPDTLATQYGFRAGLRKRIAAHTPMPYPSVYDAKTGKIVGMDYTLLIDARVTPDEMRAILEYNLDQHLAGNRSPFVFVAHSHLYAFSNRTDNPDTPSEAVRMARWTALTAFLDYARARSAVRLVSVSQVVKWMQLHGSQS